jgi:peptide/nickel transport system ATP-binding protein
MQGETPSPTAVPAGCAFAGRCPHAVDACRLGVPALEPVDAAAPPLRQHLVACLRHAEIPPFDPVVRSSR